MKRWLAMMAVTVISASTMLAPSRACAQDYPSHSITLVVPFAAAGISDNQSP